MVYRKDFSVGCLRYRLEVSDGGEVSFRVVGGRTDRAEFTPHWWHDDEAVYGMEDRNYFVNGLMVFGRVQKILLEFIRTKKPHAISFTSFTEKKQNIYVKLAERYAENIPNYMLIEYDRTIMFVRKNE